MLWEGMHLVILGIAIGLVGSASLSSVLRSLLYGLSPVDPITFVGVSVVLALAALQACYLPARRGDQSGPHVRAWIRIES